MTSLPSIYRSLISKYNLVIVPYEIQKFQDELPPPLRHLLTRIVVHQSVVWLQISYPYSLMVRLQSSYTQALSHQLSEQSNPFCKGKVPPVE